MREKDIWRDKIALGMTIFIEILILAAWIMSFFKYPEDRTVFLIFPLSMVLCGFAGYPLRLTENTIYLLEDKFLCVMRKPIRLDEIKEIFIDNCRNRKGESTGRKTLAGGLLMVRALDIHGKNYKHAIMRESVKGFRQALRDKFSGKIKGHKG